ncbi:hypothetical protein CRUP_006096 [Coryphaenoides rupestris]|nr:hypothetical protein CRUP_006096 [Coryphaenoides rupestris]
MMAVLQRSAEGCPVEAAVPGLRGRTRANGTRGRPWCSATDATADDIMERIVRSASQGPGKTPQPRERRKSRANRKSCEL